MTPTEILTLVQSARSLLELGMRQYDLAVQAGRLTEEQKVDILAAAKLSDEQVDTAVAAARERLGR